MVMMIETYIRTHMADAAKKHERHGSKHRHGSKGERHDSKHSGHSGHHHHHRHHNHGGEDDGHHHRKPSRLRQGSKLPDRARTHSRSKSKLQDG
jgi:Ni/Co efflux regulator RcnB